MRESSGAACTVLTTNLANPAGYGRIVRASHDLSVDRIVEEKDCTAEERRIDEINTGAYCFDAAVLFAHLDRLTTDNAQGEYYLTDIVEDLPRRGPGRERDAGRRLGSRRSASTAASSSPRRRKVMQHRINQAHMLAGVTMTDPDLVWIGPDVTLGKDVELLPMTFLFGATSVGDRSVIGPNTRLTDATVAEDAVVDASVVVGATCGAGGDRRTGGIPAPGHRSGGERQGGDVRRDQELHGGRGQQGAPPVLHRRRDHRRRSQRRRRLDHLQLRR